MRRPASSGTLAAAHVTVVHGTHPVLTDVSVTVAPGQAAARQVNVWAQNTQAAQAKWARNTAAVSLSDWRTAVETKGIPRIGAGASAAQGKFTTFMIKLLPFVAAAKASLPPRGTYDQNKARALAMMDAMHKFVA